MNIELPSLFLERIAALLSKQEYADFIQSFENKPRNSIRINNLKITPEEFYKIFDKQFFTGKIEWAENAFFIAEKSIFTKTPFYHAGLFYSQEASSMLPVTLLDIQKEDTILDCCASPGSKTTQIASMLNQTGLLVANEVQTDRVGRLIENTIRCGAKNTLITHQNTSVFRYLPQFFDKILLDAPCSGEGMFRREPETIRYWSMNLVQKCAATQKKILKDVLPALKVGGILLYSTCTLAPEENEENIDWILKTYPDCFEILPINWGENGIVSFNGKQYDPQVSNTKRIWSHKTNTEPFFVAKLLKKNPLPEEEQILSTHKTKIQKPNKNLLKNFYTSLGIDLQEDCIQIGYKIYDVSFLPEKELPFLLSLLKPVYLGVGVGVEKKGRIEVEHSLALSLLKEEIQNLPHIELSEKEAIAYLRGEEIDCQQEKKEGFYVVCYQSYPIGWVKLSHKKLKNYFPHSLRGKI